MKRPEIPSRRLLSSLAATALVAGLGLTGCSSAFPGEAAVVGPSRIPDAVIGDQLRSLNEALGQPADTPNADAARTLVSYNVGYELIRQTAASLDVTVAPGQLDSVYNQQAQQLGGEPQLQQAAAQQGIPPVNLKRDLETQLLAQAIGSRGLPVGEQGVDQAAAQQALLTEVRKVAQGIDVEVAPKYGQWDPEQLQLVPATDPVSKPAAEPESALTLP